MSNIQELWIVNFVLFNKVRRFLGIETDISILPYTEKQLTVSEKIAKQAQIMNCSKYLSGPHGHRYIDEKVFQERNIKIIYQDTTKLYQQYPQSIISILSLYGYEKTIKLLHSEEI